MKKFLPILLVAAGLTLSAHVKAESPSETFDETNRYYERTGISAPAATICLPYAIKSITGGQLVTGLFKTTQGNESFIFGTPVDFLTLVPVAGAAYMVLLNEGSSSFKVTWNEEEPVAAPIENLSLVGTFNDTIYPKSLAQPGVIDPYVFGKYNCDDDVCYGFCKCGVNGYIRKYRAYLNMLKFNNPFVGAPDRSDYIVFSIDGASGAITAIEEVSSCKVVCRKMFINGQLAIEKDGVLYNSLGQQL